MSSLPPSRLRNPLPLDGRGRQQLSGHWLAICIAALCMGRKQRNKAGGTGNHCGVFNLKGEIEAAVCRLPLMALDWQLVLYYHISLIEY